MDARSVQVLWKMESLSNLMGMFLSFDFSSFKTQIQLVGLPTRQTKDFNHVANNAKIVEGRRDLAQVAKYQQQLE